MPTRRAACWKRGEREVVVVEVRKSKVDVRKSITGSITDSQMHYCNLHRYVLEYYRILL